MAIKVWRLNEYEWCYGPDLDTVIHTYQKEMQISEVDDFIDKLYLKELTDAEIDEMRITDYFGREGETVSAREALNELLKRDDMPNAFGFQRPRCGLLCSSEG